MAALNYNFRKLYHDDPSQRAELLDTNFTSLEREHIKREVDVLRSLRPDLSRYAYHTSLNFPKEDSSKLDNDKLLAIAQEYLNAMEYTNNQYLIFRHHDANHPHIHLLVNRIGFDGGVVSDSNNYKRSEAVVRSIEERYGLTRVTDSKQTQRRAPKKNEVEKAGRTGKPSDKMLLQHLLKALLHNNGKGRISLPELIAKGEQLGISFLFNQASTGRITGVTYFHEDFRITGKVLGNQFKWGELSKQIDYEQNRDEQAVSTANGRTKEKYSADGRTEASASGRNHARGTATTGREYNRIRVHAGAGGGGHQDADRDAGHHAAERQGKVPVHTAGRADDAGIEWQGDADGSTNQPSTERTVEAGTDATTRDRDAGLNNDSYTHPLTVQIADDEDDALKRRRRRGRQ